MCIKVFRNGKTRKFIFVKGVDKGYRFFSQLRALLYQSTSLTINNGCKMYVNNMTGEKVSSI